MKLELALPVLGLLLCAADTTAQDNLEFRVVISKTKVTLTCPVPPDTEWKRNEKSVPGAGKEQDYVIEEYESSKHDGEYTCMSGTESLKLLLKAKVCRSCEELEVLTVAGVIIADLLITLGVLILVYYFSKNRKGRVGGSAGVHPKGQKMVRPPPVPNPDYEPIRKGQRDLYAGLQSRGF
ncbi:T-cell surface glycoprotein CD3 epsilon chain [Terrapene carolina triunguis]|uniref:T-cell surface glycoprotein CD3 epsilon chain n=1 Tax=Terrapene triunguis TaxID=2587831 RepID=UPI000E7767BD|nr:T-cell surface glycoprotein CD3 epsilon chain [Terrapene carolina triunguis]